MRYFSFCHRKVGNERKWKDAEALGVVSFHGNGGVWKGSLAFAVPVVYNIRNWLGLMRRRSANHNIAPPHPSPTCHNNAAWNDAQFIYEGATQISLSLCAQINGIDWHEGASFVVVFGPLIIAVINFVQATAPQVPHESHLFWLLLLLFKKKK